MVIQKAREATGATNVRVISDNGPQFNAKQFKSFLKSAGMDQTFTSPYYPQSNGKIERWHKELKKTCIRPKQPRTFGEAKRFIGDFIEYYNYARLHSAVGYVTPFDRMLGLDQELHESRKAKLEAARKNRRQSRLDNLIVDAEYADVVYLSHRLEPPLAEYPGGGNKVFSGGEPCRGPEASIEKVAQSDLSVANKY